MYKKYIERQQSALKTSTYRNPLLKGLRRDTDSFIPASKK